MSSITPAQFLSLVSQHTFASESDLRDSVISQLSGLLHVKPDQIKKEVTTTPFDYHKSEIADIVVYSKYDEPIKRALVVFEIKRHISIQNYAHNDYEEGRRQLHKYSQDLQAPYGVLLSESRCEIFSYSIVNGKPMKKNSLPSMWWIESLVTFRAFLAFNARGQSIWYIYAIILITLGIYWGSYYGLKLLRFL